MGAEVSGIEIGVDTLRIEGEPAQLYAALAKAQAEFAPVPKLDQGQVGKDRKFKYAGYATLMKCVRPALTANGIALIQPLHFRDGMAVTTTILAGHGASIQTSFSFSADYRKKDKYSEGFTDDCQEFGRAHTYYRRYQLQSILGIEGDDDADTLPEVKASQGYVEPARDATTGEAIPKKETKPAATPKATAQAPVDKKPVAASEPKTNGSAKASEPTTEVDTKPSAVPSPEQLAAGIPPEKLNAALSACMNQMDPKWKVIDIRNFYAKHFDAENEMPKPDDMEPALKRQILAKIIEVQKVAPF